VQNIVEFHIIGRLGRIDPAKNVTHISVATNYNRREGETWKSDPQWHRVTLFGKLRDQSYQGNESEIELRALQHEADADRALYDRLLTRLKETSIESGLQLPDAQVISRAEPPAEPAFPKLGVITPIVLIASLLFAGLLALLLESFDRGFSTPDQLEQSLGLAAIGVFPALRRRLRGQQDMSRAEPMCTTAEATRLANRSSPYSRRMRSRSASS